MSLTILDEVKVCELAGWLAGLDAKFRRTDGRADARAGGRAGWRTDEGRTDGRTVDGPWTDRGRTVDGRPDEIRKLLYMKISKFEFSDFHENSKFGRTLGRTDGRAGWRTRGLADGRRTDDGRTVDGRPHGWMNPDGWLAGWLKVLVPDARAGGRTKNGRTDGRTVDGRWTDGGRTPGRKIRNV